MFADAFTIVLRPIMFCFEWLTTILTNAGALPAFIAMFAASVVARVIIRPLVGDQVAVRTTERRNALAKSRKQKKSAGNSSSSGGHD